MHRLVKLAVSTVISSLTTYTITATNSGGSATTTIEITVNDVAPSVIEYAGNPFTSYTPGWPSPAVHQQLWAVL